MPKRLVTAALVTLGALAIAMPASASSPAETATADFMSGPFHVQFTASRAANQPADSATGQFISHGTIGGLTFSTLAGPVTCLDIRGVHLGLFYPVTSANPAFLGQLFHGVYIYVTDNRAGKAEAVSFFPTFASSTKTCAPVPGVFPITSGTATFSP
jgi:hypothetical protein